MVYGIVPDYSTVLQALTRRGVSFVVVGGFAVVAHGAVRVTMDLDLALAIDGETLKKAWETLRELGFECQQPVSREQFEDPGRLQRLMTGKGAKAISFFHPRAPFLVVDYLFGNEFVFSADDHVKMTLFGVECQVASIKKLIQMKEISGREKDRDDVEALKRLSRPL